MVASEADRWSWSEHPNRWRKTQILTPESGYRASYLATGIPERMHRNSAILTVVGLAVLGMASLPSHAQSAQSPQKAPRKTRPATQQPYQSAGAKAEALIEKNDYAAAEPILLKAATDDPKDWQAWYYL